MRSADFTFHTVDGVNLQVRGWLVEQPKAIVQVLHGMAEHGARYARLAQALADAMGNLHEFRRLTDVERAHLRQRRRDHVGHPARAGVNSNDNRLPFSLTNRQQKKRMARSGFSRPPSRTSRFSISIQSL